MNAIRSTERRRPFDSSPRATYAPNSVTGNCQLVRADSLAHAYMVAMGFKELDVTDGCALMLPPEGWA
jgi:hypothetical protein